MYTTFEGARRIGWVEKKSGWACPHCAENVDQLRAAFAPKKAPEPELPPRSAPEPEPLVVPKPRRGRR